MEDILLEDCSMAIEAAKYLIQLYHVAKVECNRQKLQKLIIFSHIALLMEGKEGIIGDEEITASTLGLGISSVSKEYNDFCIYIGCSRNEPIDNSIYLHPENSKYKESLRYNEDILTQEKRNILSYFFVNFGSYTAEILSKASQELEIYKNVKDNLHNSRWYISISSDKIKEYAISLSKECDDKNLLNSFVDKIAVILKGLEKD